MTKKLCDDCKKNEAKLKFADEPMFAITHGFGVKYICRTCFIKRLRKQLGIIEKQILEQGELMRQEEKNGRTKSNV
jgi:hypothetical protein